MENAIIVGRLATGVGMGRHFTRLDWARRQFIDKLGIDPFAGTVNLILDDPGAIAVWNRLRAEPGVRIDNPGTGAHDCDARCYRVSIEGRIAAAIVLPEIAGYSPATIELIAGENVRQVLGIGDGELVRVVLV